MRIELSNTRTLRLAQNGGTLRPTLGQGPPGADGVDGVDGVDGSNVVPTTEAILAVGDARYLLGYGSMQLAMHKAKHGGSGSVLFLGDSLGDSSTEYVHLTAEGVGTENLDLSIYYHDSNDTYTAYAAPVLLQTGTGDGELHVWNGCVPGSQSYSWQGTAFDTAVIDAAPDGVVICAGHNDGRFHDDNLTLGDPQLAFRLRYLAITEAIRQELPEAGILLVSQNAWADDNGDGDLKRDEFRTIAMARGHDLADVWQAWHDLGTATAGWYLDNVHVTAAEGELVYVETILPAFIYDPKWSPKAQPPSLFDEHGFTNLAGDMVLPLGSPVDVTPPVGWTAYNCKVNRDTDNYETTRGYAIKTERIATGSASRIMGTILDDDTVVPYQGKALLVAVRMLRPAGGGPADLPPAGNRYVGRVAVNDGVDGGKTLVDDFSFGAFTWRFVPHVVNAAATTFAVSLYADASNDGDAANPTVTWDRLSVIPGLWPKGHYRRPRQLRNAETLEGLDIGASTSATQSRIALIAAASIQRLVSIYSGINRIWQITTTGTESGTNVGGDLAFQSYDDNGDLLYTNLYLNRRFGLTRFRSTTTAARPSASAAGSGAGSFLYDSDIAAPIISDGAAWLSLQTSAGAALKSDKAATLNAQTGTTYTFVLADADKVVTATNASAQTYTVPPNSTAAIPVGSYVEVIQLGAGQVTLAAGGGVTLNSRGGALKTSGQYAVAGLRKIATDVWVVIGDVTT